MTPNREVVLHDENKARQFIRSLLKTNLPKLTIREKLLYQQYLKTCRISINKFDNIQEKQKEILNSHGITVHLLPMVFEALSKESALNYCNGIFLEKDRTLPLADDSKRRACESSFEYISTGPSHAEEERLHNAFIELFQSKFPEWPFRAIRDMSQFIAHHEGGIHCLTAETALLNNPT